MEHLTYYIIVYECAITCSKEVDHLQCGTFEDTLNYLDECKDVYGSGYMASVSIIKDGEEIDKGIVNF